MTLAAIGQLAIALGLGGVIVAIINGFLSPKTKAETKQIAQNTANSVINQSLDTLRADIKDARERAEKAEGRADRLAERVKALEDSLDAAETNGELLIKRQNQIEAQLDDALEQKDLLGAQLIAAQEQLLASQEECNLLRQRNTILLEHIRLQAAWATRYYDAGHPPGMEPPPVLMPFE